MGDFFGSLFDTRQFPPRWECGNWTEFHGWLHITSDLLVWGAYTAIPLVLIYFMLQRRDIPFNYMFLLFGMFILSCGTVHLVEAIIFWKPYYRISGLLKALTAIVSWATVFALFKVTPEALKLPGLATVNKDLENEVEERKRSQQALELSRMALRAANDELKQRNRDLDEFAHIASHDLKAPLRQIKLFSEMVIRDLGDNASPDTCENLNYIIAGADRMKTLITDLLEFSSTGQGKIRPVRVNLRELIEEEISNQKNEIDEAGAEIVIDPLPEIWGERTILSHLVQNLMSNSLKYRSPQRPLHIRISHDPESDAISFEDNGIGIEEKYLGKVFAPFVRLHSRSDYEGSGIGLAICRRVVERHHGKIWVESELGEWTRFRFTLRMAEGDEITTDHDLIVDRFMAPEGEVPDTDLELS